MSKEKNDSALVWNPGQKKKIVDTPVFSLNEMESRSPQGTAGTYIVIDANDWAAVIPEIGGDFLMVKQWRHAYGGLSLEFPGGVIEKGEDPAAGAARELLEETGCRAKEMIRLGTMSPNPALFSNRFHVFLARGLESVAEQRLDSDEFVRCERVKKEEAFKKMGGPECPHALMAAALELYREFSARFFAENEAPRLT